MPIVIEGELIDYISSSEAYSVAVLGEGHKKRS
jgi:hypothetical protein